MEAFVGAPSVVDLMLFHTTERNLYKRLFCLCRLDTEILSAIVALWLWFESIGYHGFIRHVYSYSDQVLLMFVSEAISCLEVLHRSRRISGYASLEIPATNWLVKDPIDLKFFDCNRETVLTGIQTIEKKVCNIIFDDQLLLHATTDMSQSRDLVVKLFDEGSSIIDAGILQAFKKTPLVSPSPSSSSMSSPSPSPSPSPHPSLLNSLRAFKYPLMHTLSPLQGNSSSPVSSLTPSSEDRRSMFITFSKGHPITKEDIAEFFSMTYGPVVENVMIQKASSGHRPIYGRVVFTTPLMVTFVLNGQHTAKFVIKGKHLWARMYVPRPATAQISST